MAGGAFDLGAMDPPPRDLESLFFCEEEEAEALARAKLNAASRSVLKSRAFHSISKHTDAVGSSIDFVDLTDESNKSTVSSDLGANRQPDSQLGVGAASPTFRSGLAPWLGPESEWGGNVNFFLRLHVELVRFVDYVSLTPGERTGRKAFLKSLSTLTTQLFGPTSTVVPFGSWVTGLGWSQSDLDVSVEGVPGCETSEGTVDQLRVIANELLKQQLVTKLEIRRSARVPLLRVTVNLSNLSVEKTRGAADVHAGSHHAGAPQPFEVDIILNTGDPLGTSDFIRLNGTRVYPQMRPLVILLKAFLSERGLGDTHSGGVGSYLLSCLVLGFLQQHEISRDAKKWQHTSLGHLLYDLLFFLTREWDTGRYAMSVLRPIGEVRRTGSRYASDSDLVSFERESEKSDRMSEKPSDRGSEKLSEVNGHDGCVLPIHGRRVSPLIARNAVSFDISNTALGGPGGGSNSSSGESLCVQSPLEPATDIGAKAFQWRAVKTALTQARFALADNLRSFFGNKGGRERNASLLVPSLIAHNPRRKR